MEIDEDDAYQTGPVLLANCSIYFHVNFRQDPKAKQTKEKVANIHPGQTVKKKVI